MSFLWLPGSLSSTRTARPHLYPSVGPSSPSSWEGPPANWRGRRRPPGTPARRPPGEDLPKKASAYRKWGNHPPFTGILQSLSPARHFPHAERKQQGWPEPLWARLPSTQSTCSVCEAAGPDGGNADLRQVFPRQGQGMQGGAGGGDGSR